MISTEQLREAARKNGLTIYQQEKDYFLKLFLFYYYRRYDDVVFKGGTCMRYLFGLDRFSEDLDFNLLILPDVFKKEVRATMRVLLSTVGIESYFIKEEEFENAYTCEIGFNGPLYKGTPLTRNKIRIDAGKKTGVLKKPEWRMIISEYPETREHFLVLAMNEEEMMAEKIIALNERKKGRDLYDVWFLINKGVKVDEDLLREKNISTQKLEISISEEEYERDMKRLMKKFVPYSQVLCDVKKALAI
ncbi:MAG: nucleotidyl transferase AbiEii/AbiGii toxin family protein [Methanomassiliicoccales archaeon]|nr:nucleotidyl transferase AbiEii/AbiGii toxin family protein [Methanomassiliicoccales archaeon]